MNRGKGYKMAILQWSFYLSKTDVRCTVLKMAGGLCTGQTVTVGWLAVIEANRTKHKLPKVLRQLQPLTNKNNMTLFIIIIGSLFAILYILLLIVYKQTKQHERTYKDYFKQN
jgi:hypothetical protein